MKVRLRTRNLMRAIQNPSRFAMTPELALA